MTYISESSRPWKWDRLYRLLVNIEINDSEKKNGNVRYLAKCEAGETVAILYMEKKVTSCPLWTQLYFPLRLAK